MITAVNLNKMSAFIILSSCFTHQLTHFCCSLTLAQQSVKNKIVNELCCSCKLNLKLWLNYGKFRTEKRWKS